MNIMLTDVRSLGLEKPDLSGATKSSTDGFAGMFHRQLPETSAEDNQVIDLKRFYENMPTPGSNPGSLSEVAPEVAWQEYLAQQQTGIAADSVALMPTPSELQTQPLQAHQAMSAAGTRLSYDGGEILPVSGNHLPVGARTDLALDRSFEAVPATTLATRAGAPDPAASIPRPDTVNSAVVNLAGASMDATRLVEIKVNPAAVSPHSPALSQPPSSSNPVSAATATLTGSSVAGEGPAGVVASGLTQQPAAIVDSRAQWRGTNAAVAQPVSPGLPAQGLPGDLEQAVRSDITTASAPVRVALATDPASSAESEQLVLNPATARAALTGEVARQLDKNINSNSNAAARIAPPGEIAVGMVAAAKDNLTLADITGVRDASAIAEPRNGEIHLAANSILSQQLAASLNSGSSPQGPVTAPAAALTPAQASQPNPLPAQLEGLSLSRNADATEWGKGLGDRVNWMIDQKQNRATIRLDPPFLGKLEVQIRIADDATTVTIQTQHPQTRDLIEAASSRLRDMLQDNGYQNVNVDVSQRQDQQQAQAQTASADDLGEAEDTAREDTSRRDQQDRISSLNGDGIVDTFA